MDLQFSPFRDDILASCASDCLIRLWGIPQGGLKDKMGADEALVELQGHPRKVVLMDFHPTAQRVLSSIDQDGCVKVRQNDGCMSVPSLKYPHSFRCGNSRLVPLLVISEKCVCFGRSHNCR